MMQARLALCCSHLACRSAMSTLPLASQAVTTTCMPTIWALAVVVARAARPPPRPPPLRGAGGVGAVCAAGDQADVAVAIALGLVVCLDGQQARVFALRSGVGLQADACV